MANVKISALPSYTGSAADLRWFVMNNSGETETFKYSGYTSPFKSVGTNGRITNVLDNPSNITGDYSMILGGSGNTITAGNKNAILYGENATNAGSAGCVIASQGGSITDGFGNGIFGGINTCGGNYCATIGGISNIIGGTFNDRDVIAGGQNNIFYNANNSFIGGGAENDVYGSSIGVVAGYNNTISTGNLLFVGGTQDNTITSPGYTYALIGGGYNTINNQNNSAGNAMYSSYFCSDTTINDNSVLGNSNNWFSGSRNSNLSGYGKFNHITNTYNSSITNNAGADVGEWFNKIDSSSASTITTSKSSQIIGGEGNTISGKTDVIMIGCNNRTATDNNTTYVENLKIFGQAQSQSNNVGSVSTGTRTLDFNTGNIQYFQLTSGSTIVLDATNYKDGATYIVKVKQPSSGTNATMTFTSPLFKFPNGVAPTLSIGNDEEDILSFICIGATLYGNIQKTFI